MPRLPIAASSELREGGALRFTIPAAGGAVEAFAIRFAGQVRGYVNVCTHRELPLDLGEGRFFSDDGRFLACRAHGALYDPLSGACIGGICRRGAALAAVPLVEEGGTVLLDTGVTNEPCDGSPES